MSGPQTEATAKLKAACAEGEVLEALNSQLRANQAALKETLAAEKQRGAEQGAEIADLREQVIVLSPRP